MLITFVTLLKPNLFTMLNIDDFTLKLQTILDYYSLTASAFADKIGVQRSSLSHLLSGRNKPSLDFVLKISEEFPEVDLYWLLQGKGEFPKDTIHEDTKNDVFNNQKPFNVKSDLFNQQDNQQENLNTENDSAKEIANLIENTNTIINQLGVGIEKIVVFYNDGTFKQYIQKK